MKSSSYLSSILYTNLAAVGVVVAFSPIPISISKIGQLQNSMHAIHFTHTSHASATTRLSVSFAQNTDTSSTPLSADDDHNDDDDDVVKDSGDDDDDDDEDTFHFGKSHPSFSNQHLYGRDMIETSTSASSPTVSVTLTADGQVQDSNDNIKGGSSLPLPDTYITCGKCKCLFAITEDDLGNRGKGCRVRCSVCSNEWYQSRDRLLDIPTRPNREKNDGSTLPNYEMLPAHPSELNRIARNLARDKSPDYMGVGKLYVGNLDFGTTEEDLLEFFESHAKKTGDGDDEGTSRSVEVCDVSVVTTPEGRSRGFAFVSFYDESGEKAGLDLNGVEWNGRVVTVKLPNN